MPELKKGDTYCVAWTDHLAGPFTYDGKAELLFNTLIVADKMTLDFAQEAFRVLYNDLCIVSGDNTFEMVDVIDIERIENSIALSPIEVRCIKKVRPQILKALGE